MANNIVVYIICSLAMFHITAGMNGCCNVVTIGTVVHVKCSGCRLQTVPENLPIKATELNLQNNNLTILRQDSLRYLHQLNKLILSSNGLSMISSGAVDGLQNLKYLDLSNNLLENSSFDVFAFQPLIRLTHLDLRQNRLHLKETYPEHAIAYLSQVETLKIDVFEGFRFGIGFLNLTKLKQINFAVVLQERISVLNSTFLGLERTVISHLVLHFSMKKFEINALAPFHNLVSLKFHSGRTMNIRDVQKTLYGLQKRKMEYLELTDNYFRSVSSIFLMKSDFVYLRTICVRKIDLSMNNIEGIEMDAILSWPNRKCLEILDISSNNFLSIHIFYLLVLFPSLTHLYASDQSSIKFRKRSSASMEQTLFLPHSLIYLNFSRNPIGGSLVNLTLHESNNLKVLDVSYPLRHLSCSYGRLKGLVNLTEFYMSGFECSHPNPEMFSDMPNLLTLEAKQCNLGHVLAKDNNLLFKGRYKLTFLDLSANNIYLLSPIIFADQQYSLKTLIFASNQLISLHTHILMELHALETLDVSHNRILTLTKSDIALLDTHQTKSPAFKVNLFGNPLVCSCEVLDFLDWVGTTNMLYNRDNLLCSTPDGSQIKVMTFLQTFGQFKERCASQFWLIISMIMIIVFVFTAFLSRVVWKHSVKLRVWCRQPLEYEVFPFDVFIIYCNEDARWVTRTLVPWLEQEDVEYCIDDKSFELGLHIWDNIMNAIDNSRKSIFVVSCKYFKREWQTFAMQLASAYSFRDGRENMNVIILMNDMRRSEFPKLIRKNWDKIRPIIWPDENCSDKNKLIKAKKAFWRTLLGRIKN
ncbi:Toll-like receptor 2 type-1 [Mizuhopecten yessoensis]|uniref:Toll-like receptor 2 type-1 n=2 Tax=Mizuhopecten yessoensis TaxID=6573 RepID=A0A210QLX7_MIZYE|nr:Toll-like receptor 2 type-1 [Mizuhopecten yessoensis]